jgi:hypothetical protein
MNIQKKSRQNVALQRGRFVLCRAFDVLHVYRHNFQGCKLVASIQARGGRGTVKLATYQNNPFEIRNAVEALQFLRMMRRYG